VNQYVSFIGNVIACRVASRWDFSGPAFTVSDGERSAFRALEVARDLLAAGEVEAVVVGAVDLAGGLEAVAERAWSGRDGSVGEGAGAIVLRRAADAVGRTYALVDGAAAAETVRIGLAAAVLGDTGAASGVADLIHAALCLSGRHLPASADAPARRGT